MDTKQKYTMIRVLKTTRERLGEVRRQLDSKGQDVSSYDDLINVALDLLSMQVRLMPGPNGNRQPKR